MDVQLIDNNLLSWLHQKARENVRKRQNYDLRTTKDDSSQRMLNALEPGTHVPIHRHLNTTETVVCLEGCLDWVIYEEMPKRDAGESVLDDETASENRFKEIARYHVCPKEKRYGIQVPQGAWHSIQVYEPSTIAEMKDGPYEE